MTTITLDPQTTQKYLAESVAALDKSIKDMQAERSILAAQLSASLPNGKTEIPGFGSVTVTANNTYDGDLFLSFLKPGQKQRVTTRTLDRAKAKAAYPALWESVRQPNGRKVAVKPNA